MILPLQITSNREMNMMVPRKHSPHIGLHLYGVAAAALGVIGLGWGDFATNWQRVQLDVPHREALAYFTAAYELVIGLAILWRRTARSAALLLTFLYAIFALLWVIQIFAVPGVYDSWGNFFEEFSLVMGGVVAFSSLAPKDSPWAARTAIFSRLFGVCVISFGLVHFISFAGAASWVPRWIPPGQKFWIAATGTFFFMAAGAILSGVMARLASRLLTIMIVCFEILVWIPRLIASPHDHFNWSGNAICCAIAAAAWVVSDSINQLGPSYASLRLRPASAA
jgi:uncharacterized membrane protein